MARDFATLFLERKRQEQRNAQPFEVGPAPNTYSRYGMGEQPLTSGMYTGSGPNGVIEPQLPTQRRISIDGRPYAVDEGEIVVVDASTVQAYGGPERLDQFIQANRPYGSQMGPRNGTGSMAGTPACPYGESAAQTQQNIAMEPLPRMQSGGVVDSSFLGVDRYQPARWKELIGGTSRGNAGTQTVTSLPSLTSEIYNPKLAAPLNVGASGYLGGRTSSLFENRQATGRNKSLRSVAERGTLPGNIDRFTQTPPETKTMLSKTPIIESEIYNPKLPPPSLTGEPVSEKPAAPVASPAQLDEMILDQYLSRMAGMNESERAAETQRLMQQGVSPETIRGITAASDVSRRSALGEAAAQYGTSAAERAEQRAVANRAFTEIKRRWDLTWGADEATRMANDAQTMTKESWLAKYSNAKPEDYDIAARVRDIEYETTKFDLETKKQSKAWKDFEGYLQTIGRQGNWNTPEVRDLAQAAWKSLGNTGTVSDEWIQQMFGRANMTTGEQFLEDVRTVPWFTQMGPEDQAKYEADVFPKIQEWLDLGMLPQWDESGNFTGFVDAAGDPVFGTDVKENVDWTTPTGLRKAVSDTVADYPGIVGVNENAMSGFIKAFGKPPESESEWIDWNTKTRVYDSANADDAIDAYEWISNMAGVTEAVTGKQLEAYLKENKGKLPTALQWNDWVKTHGNPDAVALALLGDETALESLSESDWGLIRDQIASGEIASVSLDQETMDSSVEGRKGPNTYQWSMDTTLKIWAQNNKGKTITVGGEQYLISLNATVSTGSCGSEDLNLILQNEGLQSNFKKGKTVNATGIRVYDMNGNPAILFICKYRPEGKYGEETLAQAVIIPEKETEYQASIV